ncbi:MAG: hypothetical protein A4E35_01800 [Methanoregula sp. PtaU1.Bin051]|nr:MAG: hypothetical protein A4E35_01800 [Methanoregula sp. PtaU1.Bin051]
MDVFGFFTFLLLAATVILISYGFDRLYAQILPLRTLYHAIRMPGIVLHELAHIIGCLITGAKIRNVVLFSRDGGSVTYAEPEIPLLGSVIISTAPLLLLPLFLVLLTWIFQSVINVPLGIVMPPPDGDLTFPVIITTVTNLFYNNLTVRFNGWFILYLYVCITIILSLGPSAQDFTNAAIGIALIAATCLLVIMSGFAPVINLLDRILAMLGYIFTVGIIFEVIVAVVSLPFLLIYGIKMGIKRFRQLRR